MNVIYKAKHELCIVEEKECNVFTIAWAISGGYDRIYLTDAGSVSGILILNSFFAKACPTVLRSYQYITMEEYTKGESEHWFSKINQVFIPIFQQGCLEGEIMQSEPARIYADLHWELIDEKIYERFFSTLKHHIVFATGQNRAEGLYKRISVAKFEVHKIVDLKDPMAFDREDVTVIYTDCWQLKGRKQRGTREFITVDYIYAVLVIETLLEFYKKNRITYYYIKVEPGRKLPQYILDKMYKGTFLEFAKDKKAIKQYYEEGTEDYLFWECDDYKKSIIIKKGIGIYLKDCINRTYNVLEGNRYTVGNPKKYNTTIHCHGSCIVRGAGVSDQSTICSYLQKEYNEEHKDVRVINYGRSNAEGILYINNLLGDAYQQGDIVIHFDADNGIDTIMKSYCKDNAINYISLADAFDEKNVEQALFIDGMFHCNHKANEIMAKYLHSIIKVSEDKRNSEDKLVGIWSNSNVEESKDDELLMEYKEKLSSYRRADYKEKVNGAIIMNCNPFTLGHLYLIEESRKKVDDLYVFVVEEDRSFFSFQDRFKLVKQNCSKFSNVIVIPSGKFILSIITFPEYFFKEEQKEAIINPAQDIHIFGKEIGPTLNIRYRFVGEEPVDKVTAQYNRYMSEKLPLFDIKLIEIPRKSVNNNIVSASYVRKLLKEDRLEEIKEYVPEVTYQFIVQRYGKNKE